MLGGAGGCWGELGTGSEMRCLGTGANPELIDAGSVATPLVMMAPERYAEAPASTAARSIDLAGTLQLGSGPSDGGAPLRWPFTSQEQQARSGHSELPQRLLTARLHRSRATQMRRSERTQAARGRTTLRSSPSRESRRRLLLCCAQVHQPADQDEPPEETEPVLGQEWVAERRTDGETQPDGWRGVAGGGGGPSFGARRSLAVLLGGEKNN